MTHNNGIDGTFPFPKLKPSFSPTLNRHVQTSLWEGPLMLTLDLWLLLPSLYTPVWNHDASPMQKHPKHHETII